MRRGEARAANWARFDQTEFATYGEAGFQRSGWAYVPERCRDLNGQGVGASPCPLVVKPGACAPPADPGEEMGVWAGHAQGSGVVILHPCVGGPVDARRSARVT